jgi:hypothetical protein
MGFRPGLTAAIRLQVILEVRYSASPNPDAVSRRRQEFQDSVQHLVLKEIPDVADSALWDWSNDDWGTGRLVAYKGGTIELFVTIVGIAEDAALSGAKRLAARALGGVGSTGYVYSAAPVEKAICNSEYRHSVSKCWTARKAYECYVDPEREGVEALPNCREPDTGKGMPQESDILVKLGQSRDNYWKPNDKEAIAMEKLRRYLSVVDFTYLYYNIHSRYVGAPSTTPAVRQRLESILSVAPPESNVIRARKQFDIWASSVYNRLSIHGLPDLLNMRAQLLQALDETETQYAIYVDARDKAEFEMEIQQFDKMTGRDQIDYIDQLAQSVEDAVQGRQLAQVKVFFAPKRPGEGVSGMGQFELNLAIERVRDLEEMPNPRFGVEDVMYSTLQKTGIALPRIAGPRIHFQPKSPLNKAMSKQDADKALAEIRARLAR